MAFGSYAALSRLLLRRSDRHPAAAIGGHELGDFPEKVVREFLALGLLEEQEPLRDADDTAFVAVGDVVHGVSIDGGGAPGAVDPSALKIFRVNQLALASRIRLAFGLGGAPAESVDGRTAWLGAVGSGSRRREYFMPRAVNAQTVVDRGLMLKARAGGVAIALLTPTDRQLPRSAVRQLMLEDIAIEALEPLLIAAATEPLCFDTSCTVPDSADATEAARLVVDKHGVRAALDGVDLDLRPRELAVLVSLATELKAENGFVRRDLIAETIHATTGNTNSNDEQIDKSISMIRSAFASVAASTETGRAMIATKKRVGFRLTLSPHEVTIF
jgi:DNA-binding winged helix-turn-helix (wHTH) protein